MASKQSKIEVILAAREIGLNTVFTKGRMAIKAFTSEASGATSSIGSLRAQVLQLAGAFAGLSAIGDIGTMLKTADQNAYGLSASIQAANREFAIGSAEDWGQTVSELSQKLKIYSESDLKGAAARTIDMTKRLGLNAEQMKKVIELSGDLAAGRTTIEGAVERVTSALRGEAEAAEFLGLTLNETYVKGWYEAKGATDGAWKSLSDLQKSQIRYNVFLEQAIPLQGRAAESINTWSGALAYVKATVADSIGTNQDLIDALRNVGVVLKENAAGIGEFVSRIASGAADVISFVAANREVVIEVLKYGTAFTVAFSVISKMSATWRGLNASMVVMTGLQIVPWLRGIEAASIAATAGVTGLKVGFVGLMGATAVFFAAYKAGEWLTMRDATRGMAEAQEQLKKSSQQVAEKLRAISESTGVNVASMKELDQAVKEGKLHYDEFTGTWKKGSKEQQQSTLATASTMKQVTGEALEAMKKKYQDYAQEVRRIQDDIAGRERSLYAELRSMARTGMSGQSSWQDQKREAEEYVQAAKRAAQEAKQAMASGDSLTASEKWKEAVSYADEAKNAYKQLNTEVKSGESVVISQNQALRTSMDGVKESGKLGIEILKQQREAIKETMDSLANQAGLAKLTEGMDDAEKKWLENWSNMASTTMDLIDRIDTRLDQVANKRRTAKLYVEEVQAHATGGLIHRLASGGKLPGYGGGDRISALLEAGEYVIRKEAVAKFGSGLFHALNSLRIPEIPRFATGGQVGASPEFGTVNFNIGGENIAGRTDRETYRALQRVAGNLQRRASR